MIKYGETFYRRHTALIPATSCSKIKVKRLPLDTKNTLQMRKKSLGFIWTLHKSMGANDPRSVAGLDPKGLDWQDLCRRPLNTATYLIC